MADKSDLETIMESLRNLETKMDRVEKKIDICFNKLLQLEHKLEQEMDKKLNLFEEKLKLQIDTTKTEITFELNNTLICLCFDIDANKIKIHREGKS